MLVAAMVYMIGKHLGVGIMLDIAFWVMVGIEVLRLSNTDK